MKTRLQAARHARDMKQSHVIAELVRRAEASGLPIAAPASLQILLSNFENGKRAVNEPYRTLFRAIYGLTDEELFGPVEDTVDSTEQAEYTELAERIKSARAIDGSTADMLARQTDYLRTMDCRLGATALIDQMTGHLATVQDALSHAILPSIRRPLASVLADAAALAAWQALDVGAIGRAWQHHETARYAALEAQDVVLLTHAMAQQAFVLVDIGEYEAAADFVQEARREAGTRVPPRFRAWLFAAEAEVLAATNDSSGSLRKFDSAAELLPAGPDAVDPTMPFIVLNEAHLSRWRGNALARLGDGSLQSPSFRSRWRSPDAVAGGSRLVHRRVSTLDGGSRRCLLSFASRVNTTESSVEGVAPVASVEHGCRNHAHERRDEMGGRRSRRDLSLARRVLPARRHLAGTTSPHDLDDLGWQPVRMEIQLRQQRGGRRVNGK